MRYSCTLFIIFVCSFLAAQNRNFHNFTLEEGLPQSNVYSIFSDSRGYLWVGTEAGVAQYDGVKFKNYNTRSGLLDNWTRCIAEDKFGRVIFGSNKGISVFDGRNFSYIDSTRGFPNNPVLAFEPDWEGNIWTGTSEGGAMVIKYKNNPDSLSIEKILIPETLGSNQVFTICSYSSSFMILGTFGAGMYVIDSRTKKLIRHIEKPLIPSNHILSIKQGKDGDLWIGSYDKGAFKINISTNINSSLHLKTIETEYSEERVWDVLPDNNGNIWLATNEHGIIRIKENTTEVINSTNGLPGNQIFKVFEDGEKNIWLGTIGNGLCQFKGDHFSHYTPDDGISNKIFGIKSDSQGNLWLATNGNGLLKVSFKNNKPLIKTYKYQNGFEDYINSVDIDKKGNIWLGTASSGLIKFDGVNTRYITTSDGLINNEINRVMVDSKGRVWVGTIGGLSIYDGNKFFNIDSKNYGLVNNDIQAIIETKNGEIWVGTVNGLACFVNNKMTIYDETDGLNDKQITALAAGPAGSVFIGTLGGGLYVYNPSLKNVQIKLVGNQSDLGSNNINSLQFLTDYQLIVATDKGFDKIVLNNKLTIYKIFHYDKTNGFWGIENNQNAICKDSKGQMWFGTVKGLTRFNPEIESRNAGTPPLKITAVKLFFKEFEFDDNKRTNNFSLPTNLSLKYTQNHISFQFIGISLRNPQRVHYKYMLEGLEKDWSPAQRTNEVVYSGLKPGKYIFKLLSVGENGKWTPKPIEYKFEIKPPFWETLWFISLMVLLIALLVVSFIRFREQKLRKDKEELERVVKVRTAEVVKQKDEIEEQKDKIEEQKEVLEEQKKEIHDSINYASRIQMALLPSQKQLCNYFCDNFILFKPRDIVSGDFYWCAERDDKILLAVADCTGHGVPGAFMSMLGISFLNEIVVDKGITSPAEILNQLRDKIIKALQQEIEGSEMSSKDGMDIIVMSFDKELKNIQYSGANNTLFHISNGQFKEYERDKMPVAIYGIMNSFSEHTIVAQPGDVFILRTDGFEDQFGGPRGKKFMVKQLKELVTNIHQQTMQQQHEKLQLTIESWMNESNATQIDDITILGIRI